MIKLYDFPLSGNCHKVRLLLSFLNLDYEKIPVDLKGGEHKQAPFLQLNPFGQIPVLTDGETVIRDSQAILVYLARQYGGEDWLPLEAALMGKVMQWLSTATKEIALSLVAARVYHIFGSSADIETLEQQSHALLKLINNHLNGRNWLEGTHPTIADIACFPYIGLSSDAKISLETYSHVLAWISRIKLLPGYVSMPGL